MSRHRRILFITVDVVAVVSIEVLRALYPELPPTNDRAYRIIAGHLVMSTLGPEISEKILLYIIDKIDDFSFTFGAKKNDSKD